MSKNPLHDAVDRLAADAGSLRGDVELAVAEAVLGHDLVDDTGAERIEALRAAVQVDPRLGAALRQQLLAELDSVEANLLALKRQVRPFVRLKGVEPAPAAEYVSVEGKSIFHRPECEWLADTRRDRLAAWDDHADAVAAGLKPCKTCRS